jgi:hypothetical protein
VVDDFAAQCRADSAVRGLRILMQITGAKRTADAVSELTDAGDLGGAAGAAAVADHAVHGRFLRRHALATADDEMCLLVTVGPDQQLLDVDVCPEIEDWSLTASHSFSHSLSPYNNLIFL